MKKIRNLLLLLAIVSLVGLPLLAAAGSADLPGPDGKAVWNYITKVKPYHGWALWPDKGKFYKGQHPHGALLTTYVSPGALKTIKDKSGSFPDGTFIVKENYSPKKMLGAVTVMYRINGYNADAGDWFWAKYGGNGKIMAEGKVAGCTNCHQAKIMNDWVFTGPVK
ncbi:MAG TPA: hypothetical protein ENH32_02640 [Proteobacteria bacterium]|nr:hypothetical protein BMS3Abin14_01020 [bacterium BMS3Abin14]HDL52852.1 hypothetical protein [Pseudomonadota bacterium]